MNRLAAMRVIAVIMAVSAVGFGLFTIVFGIVSPEQEIHAVHNAVVASLLLVLSAPPVIAVARRSEDAIHSLVILAAVAIAGLATMVLALTPDPFTLPFVVLIGVLWAIVPSREGAWPDGRPSWPMLALMLAGTVLLLPFAIDQADLQRVDHSSEHAAFFHWVETSFYTVALVLLGLLGALRPVAFRMATWLSGLASAILGAASIAFHAHASALPSPWGWAALVGGVAFVAVGEWESRRA